ncbi:MAG: cytoplasmic protein [Candidatus Lokiarchaeota archaeon]|nr:cytoplasmic protein [Candidatus Lokiarchaeota archaeon]
MKKKYALYAFNGDPMCVVHVWLNALDMREKGYEVKVIVEGSATKMIKEYHENEDAFFRNLYLKVKEKGLIAAVCKACSNKMGSLEAAKSEDLPIEGSMSGHPPMSKYIEEGYEIINF